MEDELKQKENPNSKASSVNGSNNHDKNHKKQDENLNDKENNKENSQDKLKNKTKKHTEDLKHENQTLKNEIEQLKKSQEENQDLIQRQKAEFDNYRKRVNEEKDKLVLYGGENVLKSFLKIYDNYINALEVKTEDENTLAFLKGFQLLKNDMDKFLEEHHVNPSTKVGDDFNPNIHQAIQISESDKIESEKVAEVFQQGFLLRDKMIREAVVKVEKPAPKPQTSSTSSNEKTEKTEKTSEKKD